MTLKSKLPLHLIQKYFLLRDQIESIFRKIEVIIDSNAIIYSVRILIVLLALLMGYIHTPKEKKEFSDADKIEITNQNSSTGFTEISK